MTERTRALRSLPGSIWALGLGSLFMDMSSELVHSLLPILMATVLGAGMATIGLIEGIAEATASVLKVFSGALSDRLRKRDGIVVAGYALSALTKPIFALAGSISWVFGARFADRVGKGIRGAPRDALIADITPVPLRGAAYGLRQSLDSVGAFLGPLLAVGLMAWLANDVQKVLWFATLPALVAVACIALAVRGARALEAPRREAAAPAVPPVAAPATIPAPAAIPPLSPGLARRLPLGFWLVVAVGAVVTLARFSDAFLILRAQDVGLAIGQVPVVMIVMNLVYSALAYPSGILSDRLGPRLPLAAGLALLVAADLVLARADGPAPTLLGAALWGAHMGLTQGLFSKLIADAAPPALRGTAFGIFHLVGGGAVLLASVIAGALWSAVGPEATFLAGAAFAALAALGVAALQPASPGPSGAHR